MAQMLTKNNFDETLKNGLVLVDFYANWCPPCKAMAPVIDKLDEEYQSKGVVIAKVDVDKDSEIASRFDITSIPTFILFKNSKPVWTTLGITPKHKFIEEFTKAKINT